MTTPGTPRVPDALLRLALPVESAAMIRGDVHAEYRARLRRYGRGRAGFRDTWATVVGVIDDIRDRSPRFPSTGQVYWPFSQSPRWELRYVLRTDGDPTQVAHAVRGAVASVQPDLAPYDLRPMHDRVTEATADAKYVVQLARLFSALALALAAVGLYGIITYNPTRRVRELALRIALGATAQAIARDVLQDGVRLGTVGIAFGLAAGFGLTRLLRGMLYGVSATDATAFLGGAAVLFTVAVGAGVAPALWAVRAEPATAMRPE